MAIQHHNFTLLKTTLIGLTFSALSAIALFYLAIHRQLLPRGGYIWSYEFNKFTTYNPVWWIAVLASFVIAFIIARRTKWTFLWIALTLIGCLALYLGSSYSLRHLVNPDMPKLYTAKVRLPDGTEQLHAAFGINGEDAKQNIMHLRVVPQGSVFVEFLPPTN